MNDPTEIHATADPIDADGDLVDAASLQKREGRVASLVRLGTFAG